MKSKNKPKTPDFVVRDAGTLLLFSPLTPAARTFIEEHVVGEVTWFGNALVCERRFGLPLAEGILSAGLVLA